jgi:DNA-binding transcriptional ArsR family regulator
MRFSFFERLQQASEQIQFDGTFAKNASTGIEVSFAQDAYDRAMEMGARVSEIGSLLGDPVRAAMLTTLLNGKALPAGELAFIGNIAPQTASFHLGKLLESRVIAVERQGKHKYYRLANEQVALALETLASIAPVRVAAEARALQHTTQRRANGLQTARTCYRHLAGGLAIQIHDALLACRFILPVAEKQFELTEDGALWLAKLTPTEDRTISRREHVGRACLDWTERRHHIGGPLGVILLARLKEAGWLLERPGSRALGVSLKGREGLERQFGVRGV